MKREISFKRNVYIILIVILALAILTQIARSQFVLQFNQNEKLVSERQELVSQVLQVDGTQEAVAMTDETYCIVYRSEDEASELIMRNAEQTLSYMKRDSLVTDLSKDAFSTEGCTAMLMATGMIDGGSLGADRLSEFVYNGGSVYFMQTLEINGFYHQLYRKLGILSFNYPVSTMGIRLTSNVLLGEEGLETGEDFLYNASLPVELDNEADLLAESLEGIPLMWKRQYGEGTFIVFNGSILNLKGSRGMIAGGISLLKPDFMYPIFNSKVFYIDDFPAPIRKGLDATIYREYGLDIPTFYQQVWWPDMLKAAKKYDIIYTAVAIQTYNDQVTPPFKDPIDQERHHLIAYGREVIKSGGELGIHGYNHQSLQQNEEIAKELGYAIWPNRRHMEESIRVVLDFVKSAFPNYTLMTYVPPSNVLSREGREALKQAWPDLAVIASLYDTDYSNKAYVQEYEVAPDGIIEMPRVTSGYYDVPYYHWLEANAMTTHGVFSHFIHPDDLLDETRSRKQTWEKLYEDFSAMLSRLDKTYPWLRDMTATEAGLDMAKSLRAEVRVTRGANGLEGSVVNHDHAGPLYFVLRSDKKITRQVNCSVGRIDRNTYLVSVYDSNFSIGLGG
jgi:Uncharacterized protein conserved in bacteria